MSRSEPRDDGPAVVRRGVARHADCGLPLAVAGPARQLEVALEHLGDAVHAPVAERPPPDSAGRAPERSLSMPPSATKRCASPGGQKPSDLQPEPHERREPVVHLGQVHVLGPEAGVRPQPTRHLGAAVEDVVEGPVQREAGTRQSAHPIAGYVHRRVRKVSRPFGRREHEGGHTVDGDVAVETTDRIEQRGASRRTAPRSAVGRASSSMGCERRSCGLRRRRRPCPRDGRRTVGGTRCRAGRSWPVGRSSPGARSTAADPPPSSWCCRGSGPGAGCGAPVGTPPRRRLRWRRR